MNPDEYMSSRVDDQINYYDNQSIRSKNWQHRLTAVQIIAGGLVPIISGFSANIAYSEWIIAGLGLAVTVATAFLSLNKYQERAINFRLTCETLKHHKHLFLTGVSPYKGDEAFDQFVNDIEAVISPEKNNQ